MSTYVPTGNYILADSMSVSIEHTKTDCFMRISACCTVKITASTQTFEGWNIRYILSKREQIASLKKAPTT